MSTFLKKNKIFLLKSLEIRQVISYNNINRKKYFKGGNKNEKITKSFKEFYVVQIGCTIANYSCT